MLHRIGISLHGELLERFDKVIEERGWANRSEAVRDLIRALLVEEEWQDEAKETMAAVVLVFDHHRHDLAQKLAELQHDSYATVISTMHVHMDHDNCLEISALKGKPDELKVLADAMIGTKGVKHGKFIPTTLGKNIE